MGTQPLLVLLPVQRSGLLSLWEQVSAGEVTIFPNKKQLLGVASSWDRKGDHGANMDLG